MPKYLLRATHTREGLDGLLKDGGTIRRDTVAEFAQAMGGSMEAFYYAFGDTDAYIIVDVPDNVIAAAASLIGNLPGTTKTTFTVLITPEEMDQAVAMAKEKSAAYRPPGR